MKKQKGITLIALVVTIILLLILAGVTLNALWGENGLITRTIESSFKTIIKGYQEQAYMYILANQDVITNAGIHADNPNTELGVIIKGVKDEYEEKICVENNEFYYVPLDSSNKTKQEVKWCFDVDVKVKGYDDYDDYENDGNLPNGDYIAKNGVYVCEPDLRNFNKETTFYVTYDENGTETIGNSIKSEEPKDWYDYQNKKWANIVTKSGENVSYWVWIPRYVYSINEQAKKTETVDVKFVDLSNTYIDFNTKQKTVYSDTEPTYDENGNQTNYCLPEAFKWDGQDIPGYWVSKYEVSAAKAEILCSMDKNSITIEKLGKENLNETLSSYDVYINDELRASKVQLPYEITGLQPNTEYRIKLIANTSAGVAIEDIEEEIVKTLEDDISRLTKPDMTGFNPNTTYYVTYDESGSETRTPITENQPENWYDYKNKEWANIVTVNGEKEAYFVWVPKYEYKIKNLIQQVQIRFISKNVTEPTNGYSIPEAFKWDGQDLSGYWVSKYEVSQP